MKYAIFLCLAGTFVSTLANAEPIADRKALMKSNGEAMGVLGATAKGEREFDAAAVMAALEQLNANAEKFDVEALFPEGSDTGDTKAAPKIWEDMAGFTAAADKFKEAAAAAAAAAPDSRETLQPQVGAVGQTCGACHETYRLPST
ncbi:cytochrome c [Mesorhizobium sp. YIM 152430]|jgi:cytochrome c556|uniref:c-type cytochrome n=1 Tax=Mesorhizobium sp. YIM 152430 TaxID=3031761 RepID=UPI0023DADE43|nr:cytochrome c [Mesorhizobium sp. YIM 152430]MDF1599297.1 cytochrome c [Mesorhizobium sp. YIM 152430]